MTNKIKLLTIILIIAAAVFTSCGAGISDRLTSAEVEAYEDYIMSSYFILRGDASLPESRAAWDYTAEILLPADGQTKTATSNNYPEKGQSTTVTISRDASWEAGVYKVVNFTTYPKRDSIISTTESYYIKDGGDGYLVKDIGGGFYSSDPICDLSGTVNSLARIEFKTIYADGTERDEVIIATKDPTGGSVSYADFDINSPLVFPVEGDTSTWGGGTLAADEWSPAADAGAVWSSMIAYNQTVAFDFLFWNFSSQIIGVRYYTENSAGLRTSVTYERVIGITTALAQYIDWSDKLFNGRNKDYIGTAEGTTYTETVIRTSIDANLKKTIKTSSQVYDEAGAGIVNFTANYAEDENGVVTSSGAPVAVY